MRASGEVCQSAQGSCGAIYYCGISVSVLGSELSGFVSCQGEGKVKIWHEGQEYRISLHAESVKKITTVEGVLKQEKILDPYPVFPPCEEFCRNTIYNKGNPNY